MKANLNKITLAIVGLFLCSAFAIFKETNNTIILKRAKDENKNIAIYFAGSDWCAICHVFKNEFLNQTEVGELLKSNYVFYVADFPQRTKLSKEIASTNDMLAEKLNPNGTFPLLVIADQNLKVIKTISKSMPYDNSLLALKENIKK